MVLKNYRNLMQYCIIFFILARIQVDPNIVTSLTWDESTPLSYLIPTLTGDGACTVALVGVLVQIHNDFIEKCESRLRKEQKMRK